MMKIGLNAEGIIRRVIIDSADFVTELIALIEKNYVRCRI